MMNSKYKLINAQNEDFDFIKEAKIATIFEYAKNISKKEKEDILSYIDRYTNKFLSEYKIILKDNKRCGVFLYRKHEDGYLLDEIYLLQEYRNLGIGSQIIQQEISKHDKTYLWVYKENIRAVKLYKSLNFNVIDENDARLYMLYKNN